MGNGFRAYLVLVYLDMLPAVTRCYGFVHHSWLTLNRLLLLLIVDWNTTGTGDLDGLSLLFPVHTRLRRLLWLSRSSAKLYRALVDDFTSTLQNCGVSSGDLVMTRGCFAAVDNDLLRGATWWALWTWL